MQIGDALFDAALGGAAAGRREPHASQLLRVAAVLPGICAASGTAQASADASAANPRIGRIMGPPATAGDVAQAILRPGSKECNPIGMSACEPVKRLTVKRARAGASEIV